MTDNQTPAPAWEEDAQYPGIIHAIYRGHRLTIKPIGVAEFDGFVDGVLRSSGTDDREIVQIELVQFVDRSDI